MSLIQFIDDMNSHGVFILWVLCVCCVVDCKWVNHWSTSQQTIPLIQWESECKNQSVRHEWIFMKGRWTLIHLCHSLKWNVCAAAESVFLFSLYSCTNFHVLFTVRLHLLFSFSTQQKNKIKRTPHLLFTWLEFEF